ncbi:hypothetical protein CDQ78_09560 [Campylobacter hyointestinalis subsp. hyointestinalis]|uniref:DUF1698 domain-containing protein n=1 Tax=Campylobacter hyointestinalis subsp. hyointestinalis TaxID=91352 RepID=A0A855N1I0_CAMHY|nr:hypothetical protein CDQ78_09560 [Campylobacter hyointestinalis subsp. hyointestinalis]
MLRKNMNKIMIVFIRTMYVAYTQETLLMTIHTYSKIPNIYFVPSISALKNWCERAGFKEFEVLATKKTDENEQRKTEWIDSFSLENFLDPKDKNLTIEGYEAPKRVYIRIKI